MSDNVFTRNNTQQNFYYCLLFNLNELTKILVTASVIMTPISYVPVTERQ